jgi:hypothetical protein
MDTPRKFSYAPPRRAILFFLAFGLGMLALSKLLPSRIAAAIAILPLIVAVGGTLRRLVAPAFIELGQDAILLPFGFLQIRKTKIPYARIERVWEDSFQGRQVLYLWSGGRRFSVNSMLLVDSSSFSAIKDLVNSQVPQIENAEKKPVEAGAYCFKCSWEGNGEISNSQGEVLWRVKTPFNSLLSPLGIGPVGDLSFFDKLDKELFKVRTEWKFLQRRYVLSENGSRVCTICPKSILFSKYTLDFVNGENWSFRLPHFTVFFTGLSKTGAKIRVRNWNHKTWSVLIDPASDSPKLVAALAFIHRQRLRSI